MWGCKSNELSENVYEDFLKFVIFINEHKKIHEK